MVPRLSPRARAVLALVAANVIWGTTFVAIKPMLERLPPLTVASARFAIALAILLPLLARAGGRPARGPIPALMGLTGVFLLYLCQNVGLQYTSAANAALIHGGIPVLTALVAAPVLGERLGARRLVGLAVSLAGVAAIVLLGEGATLGLRAVGDALLLASALSIAAYLVLGRRFFPAGGSLALVTGVARYGLLFLLPATAVELAVSGAEAPTAGDLLRLAYLGAGASALAFVLWGYGLTHLEAGQAAAFTNLKPIVGLAVAALVLAEPISAAQLGGAALVLGGVWLATRQPAAPPRPVASVLGTGRASNGGAPARLLSAVTPPLPAAAVTPAGAAFADAP